MLLTQRFRDTHLRHVEHFFADPILRQMGALYVSAAIRDVTERHEYELQLRQHRDALLEKQQELERLARVDALTGLVNHAETIARLQAALDDRRRPGACLGVLFCDTDHFKVINDTWGHSVGDIVLATLARRIRDCVREDDTVGRIGGDEMLVLLPEVQSIDEVYGIAEKIRRHAAEPIEHQGNSITATLSIGATLATPDESVSTMTARADAAMYEAKRTGRNTVTIL